MKITAATSHTRTYQAALDEREIKDILAAAFASEAGITLDARHKVDITLTKEDTSTGFRHAAKIRVIEDISTKEPEAPAPKPVSFSGSVRAPIKPGDIIEWVERGDVCQGTVLMNPTGSHLMVGVRTLDEIRDVADPDSLKIVG